MNGTLKLMLDDFSRLSAADESGFLARLTALPGSYDGPDGLRSEPYGLLGFGEASALSAALQSWVDAPLVVSGTQFMLASGFDYGELGALKLSAEQSQADVVVLGYAAYQPDFRIAPGVLSLYTYASYLAHATGHSEALVEAETAMVALRDQLGPQIETERNPAKALAWALWNRVPLLLAPRSDIGALNLLQRVLARVGKSLSINTGDHPLEMLAGAFEGRHNLADDVVGLIVGEEDEEMRLAREVLETRASQLETLTIPFGGIGAPLDDPGARALVLWYISLWVAAYLAFLHDQSPEDSQVYEALRAAQ